jgi:hypothetical protein
MKATLRLNGLEIRALREQFGLTQSQFAGLARSKVTARRPGLSDQANGVGKWESGEKRMTESTAELVQCKLLLLQLKLTTLQELLESPLHDILCRLRLSRRRGL